MPDLASDCSNIALCRFLHNHSNSATEGCLLLLSNLRVLYSSMQIIPIGVRLTIEQPDILVSSEVTSYYMAGSLELIEMTKMLRVKNSLKARHKYKCKKTNRKAEQQKGQC